MQRLHTHGCLGLLLVSEIPERFCSLFPILHISQQSELLIYSGTQLLKCFIHFWAALKAPLPSFLQPDHWQVALLDVLVRQKHCTCFEHLHIRLFVFVCWCLFGMVKIAVFLCFAGWPTDRIIDPGETQSLVHIQIHQEVTSALSGVRNVNCDLMCNP